MEDPCTIPDSGRGSSLFRKKPGGWYSVQPPSKGIIAGNLIPGPAGNAKKRLRSSKKKAVLFQEPRHDPKTGTG